MELYDGFDAPIWNVTAPKRLSPGEALSRQACRGITPFEREVRGAELEAMRTA